MIDRGANQAKPRRKRAKYLDTRSGRIRLAAIPDNSAASIEGQRLGEALARVDAQRVKLTSQLTELEATERVLARYSKGTQTRKTL